MGAQNWHSGSNGMHTTYTRAIEYILPPDPSAIWEIHFIQSWNVILVGHWVRATLNEHFELSNVKFNSLIKKITFKRTYFGYYSFEICYHL